MSKLTAAQMTQDLPLAVEPNRPRRLARRERQLLCRLIDVALCVDELPLDTSECARIAAIREKLRPIRRRRLPR